MTTKYTNLVKVTVFLSVLLLFMQCENEEPSTEAKLETSIGLFTNAAIQGKLTIDDAYIHIAQLDLQLNATDGTQSNFSSPNTGSEKISLVGETTLPFVFDVHQGKYDPVIFGLSLLEGQNTLNFLPAAEGVAPLPDFENFVQNAKPALVLAGKFTNRGQAVRVLIAIDAPTKATFFGAQKTASLIGLAKNNRAKISVDPAYLLQDISSQRLEDATMFNFQGHPTILIHPQFNTDLYMFIEDRMFDSPDIFKADVIEIKGIG